MSDTHTHIHTYIHTQEIVLPMGKIVPIERFMPDTFIHTYIHTYTHTHTHTYVHTYVHT